MKNIAAALASKGRGPDTTLVHMSQPEVAALAKMAGVRSLPKNPETGLPEAGLLSMVLPLAASYFMGPAALEMFGGNAMLAGAATGAISGGLGSMMNGQGLSGALTGGLTGGAMGQMGLMAKGDTPGLAPGSNLAGQSATVGSNLPATGETLAAGTTGGGAAGLPQGQQIMSTPGQGYAGMYGATPAQAAGQFEGMPASAVANATNPAASMVTPVEGYTAGQGASANTTVSPQNIQDYVDANLKAGYAPTDALSYAKAGVVMPQAAPKPQGIMSKTLDMAKAHPYIATGAAAAGIYGLSQAMKPPTPLGKHAVQQAGQSTSGITQTGVAPTYGGAENVYFANNTPTNYTTAPGATVMRYAEGGQVNTGDLFNAPLMPDHQRQSMDPTMAQGGMPGYAQGGILNLRQHTKHMNPMFIRGSGDGMSDSIPAVIAGRGNRPNEPIRVAESEYIVPADAVAHIGNGSSNAGAKKMDAMVAKVRKAKTGKTKQPAEMDMSRFMPA